MLASLVFAPEGTPLWKQILTGIPHDAAAVVGYALVALFGAAIWLGSRKRSQ